MTRNIWIGVVVVIVLVAGGWWYLSQSSAPATSETTQLPTTQTAQQQNTNTATQPVVNNQTSQVAPKSQNQTYTNSAVGFSATVPSSWHTVAETAGGTTFPGSTFLASADYVAKSQAEIAQTSADLKSKIGEPYPTQNIVKQGTLVTISSGQQVAAGTDAASYVALMSDQKYSNLVSKKEISLGGQPAFLLQTRLDDGSLRTAVSFVRNGKSFEITASFGDQKNIDWTAWEQFLSTFKFS